MPKEKQQPAEPAEKAAQQAPTMPAMPAAPQVSVREWALGHADAIGLETALAFVATYGSDTGTPDELESALGAWRSRVVHEEP
jgi:hypothetical protein